ncbi:hypothetical protein [Cupriavidus laharis]|nr:hypothetical protein [Cupriavidus laharis]
MRQNDAGGMTGTTLETAVAGVRLVPPGISPCQMDRHSPATREGRS